MMWSSSLLVLLLLFEVVAEVTDGDDEHPVYVGTKVVTELTSECLDSELDSVNALVQKYPLLEELDGSGLPEYEDPRDEVNNSPNLSEWLQLQQWRSFTSTIGKPSSRRVQDVVLQYVTIRGGGDKGTLIVVIGRAQVILEYDELLDYFMNKGYDPIYIYAHRGQGESDRLLGDINYPAHYVEKASDLVTDLRTFVDLVRKETSGSSSKPLYAFCHSMGCGITLRYVIEEYQEQRPQVFNAIVASGPYIKAITKPFPYGVAVGLMKVMVRLGLGKDWAPSKKITFEQDHSYVAFHNNTLTHSYTRWKRMKDHCMDNRYKTHGDDGHLGLCLYGLATRTLKIIFDFDLDTFRPFMRKQEQGKLLAVPMLLQGGAEDPLVDNSIAKDLCENFAQTCTYTEYAGSKHQMHAEVDSIRTPALAEMDLFMASHREGPVPQNPLPIRSFIFSRAVAGGPVEAVLLLCLLAVLT